VADRRIFPDGLAEDLKAEAGKPYRPSNGIEGEIFQALWCAECRHNRTPDGNGCLIELAAWAYDLGEEGYPSEWQYGADGQPRCTAFEDRYQPARTPRCKATDDLFCGEARS